MLALDGYTHQMRVWFWRGGVVTLVGYQWRQNVFHNLQFVDHIWRRNYSRLEKEKRDVWKRNWWLLGIRTRSCLKTSLTEVRHQMRSSKLPVYLSLNCLSNIYMLPVLLSSNPAHFSEIQLICDGRTDTTSFRDARTHLKKCERIHILQ